MRTEAVCLTPGRLIATGLNLLVVPLLVLALSGDWAWWRGWVFGVWYAGFCGFTVVWLYRHDPGLLEERFRRPGTGGEEGWDRPFVYAISVLFLVWIAVIPLEARRFNLLPGVPLPLVVVGALLLGVATFFLFRAFSDNHFLSPLVRIQAERGHQVVSTGVYGLVRHPMYLGADCLMVGAPLFLGSWLGTAIGLLVAGLLTVRLIGEERMLVDRLEGYAAYRQKVRYRLVPGIW